MSIDHEDGVSPKGAPVAKEGGIDYGSLSRIEIDKQIHATASIKNRSELLLDFLSRSKSFVKQGNCETGVSYGPTVDETLDIFFPDSPSANTPVHVFIHGGYWYQFTKEEWSFIAKSFCDLGVIVIVPSYSLCPLVKVTEILRQIQGLISWVYKNVAEYGGDPEQIHVSGHSVGGYMTAMLVLTDWAERYNLPGNVIKSATAISGIYNLKPLTLSYLQQYLRFEQSEIDTLSLKPFSQKLLCSFDFFVGEEETEEFRRQSKVYAESWLASQNAGAHHCLPEKNHLSILYELSNPDGVIFNSIRTRMNLGKPVRGNV